MKKKLTPKQEFFCKEYLIDLNATQAAKRAGYSKKTAEVLGYQLLQIPLVLEEIERLKAKRAAKLEITAERVLGEIAKLAFANMQDYIQVDEKGYAWVDLSKLTRAQAAAIQEVTSDSYVDTDCDNVDEDGEPIKREVKKVKIKLSDKGQNLERLGKHLKLFTDVHEQTPTTLIHMSIDALKDKNANEIIAAILNPPKESKKEKS